eukprot:gb/GEZN01012095.1/.p1 GENE.gb/GEZN01012095.1/~~gb/GEZN01012095.1/.p1  ORF type:complete len:294 (-),score=44.54 gb/GEZN01012095.1/:82-963(-)
MMTETSVKDDIDFLLDPALDTDLASGFPMIDDNLDDCLSESPSSSIFDSSSTSSSPDNYLAGPYSPGQLPDLLPLPLNSDQGPKKFSSTKEDHSSEINATGPRVKKPRKTSERHSGSSDGDEVETVKGGKKRGRKKSSTLTEEEKRVRAKESAARYRKRKNATNQQLGDKVDEQNQRISKLEIENRVLKDQVSYFRKLLVQMGLPNTLSNLDLDLPSAPAAGLAFFALFSFFLVFSPWTPKKVLAPTNRQLLHDASDALTDPHFSLLLIAVSSVATIAFSLRILLRRISEKIY